MLRVRPWGVTAALCWLVALVLAIAPVAADYPGGRPDNALRCPRPITAALADPRSAEGLVCWARSRARVGTLGLWLVLTGAISTGFVASCALSRSAPAPARSPARSPE